MAGPAASGDNSKLAVPTLPQMDVHLIEMAGGEEAFAEDFRLIVVPRAGHIAIDFL